MCNREIESRVKELRKLVGKIVTNVIYFSQAKGKVQPEKVFKDGWRKMMVIIHDRSLLTPFFFCARAVFACPSDEHTKCHPAPAVQGEVEVDNGKRTTHRGRQRGQGGSEGGE